jgi:hypothetical protein
VHHAAFSATTARWDDFRRLFASPGLFVPIIVNV